VGAGHFASEGPLKPMQYLLDTNICVYVINKRPPEVIAQFISLEEDGIGVSSITAAELYAVVRKSGSRRNLDAAQTYGEVRAALEKKGTPIGPLHTQIAAHAIALDLTLVTNNLREFKRVAHLRLENWA
jgi:tRNA(fMet)-specific endonuclease VapC